MVELVIKIYTLVCLLLILFQIGFLIIMSVRARIEQYIIKNTRRKILYQMEQIFQNKPLTDRHRTFVAENLKQPIFLYCYEKTLESILCDVSAGTLCLRDPDEITNVTIYIRHNAKKHDTEEHSRGRSRIFMRLRPKKELIRPLGCDRAKDIFERYLRAVSHEMIDLTSTYCKKNTTLHAFYVFVLKKYRFTFYHCTSELIANLKDLIEYGDSSCAEGVMLAVYTMDNPDRVIEFLELVDSSEKFVHPKIISDGILSYTADKRPLNSRIISHLERFSPEMQVNLLNYLRFTDNSYCAEILKILENESVNDEVRFCCIRYFGKYHYDPAYDLIADFAEFADDRRVEYAVVSLMALRNYPCERTLKILSRHIHHPNWYIRYNATESMKMLGIEYQDLVDVFDGRDRYAREMLQYKFDQRYILEKEVDE